MIFPQLFRGLPRLFASTLLLMLWLLAIVCVGTNAIAMTSNTTMCPETY